MMPLGGGSGGAADVARADVASLADDRGDLLVDFDDDAVGVELATALSRRAASASRLARLRAALRCFESWRLSGTAPR
jgi:hypothetical protein